MDLQEICDGIVRETDAVLNCLVVDLDTGRTLVSANHPGSSLREDDIDAAIRTGKAFFRGRYVDRFVQSLATGLIPARGFVREVQITSEHGYQFMAAIPGREDAVLVLFTGRSLTLGLGWMAVHQAQELLAESLGGLSGARREPASPDPPPPAPELPSEAAVDPEPVPPPGEAAAPEPLPNPLVNRRRNATSSKSAKSRAGAGEPAAKDNADPGDERGGSSWSWSRKQ